MKVMVLLSRIPWPLEKGDKLRAYHHIRALSKENNVILVCLTDAKPHPEAISHLSNYCQEIHFIRLSRIGIVWNLFKAWFNDKPFQVNYFYQKKAQKKIDRLIETHMPRHIFLQLVRTAEYIKKYHLIPTTFDYMDAFSVGAQRRINFSFPLLKYLLKKEAKRLKQYESAVFNKFAHKTIISKNDRDLIEHPDRDEIILLPNGVDFKFFFPIAGVEKTVDLLFTGNMSYPPNIEAAKLLANEILPILWKTRPETKLVIAGTNPHRSVRALAGEQVIVTGWVDDIRKQYASAKVFIAPMQIGTGMQNKILEAMAMQIPCITSALAAGAIGAEENQHVLLANNANEFAKQAHKLLENESLRNSLSNNAFDFVKSAFSWPENSRILLSTLKES